MNVYRCVLANVYRCVLADDYNGEPVAIWGDESAIITAIDANYAAQEFVKFLDEKDKAHATRNTDEVLVLHRDEKPRRFRVQSKKRVETYYVTQEIKGDE